VITFGVLVFVNPGVHPPLGWLFRFFPVQDQGAFFSSLRDGVRHLSRSRAFFSPVRLLPSIFRVFSPPFLSRDPCRMPCRFSPTFVRLSEGPYVPVAPILLTLPSPLRDSAGTLQLPPPIADFPPALRASDDVRFVPIPVCAT